MVNQNSPILEVLQTNTSNSFLQQNYPAANQNLLNIIAALFANKISEEESKEKQVQLSNLHVDKQNIDKQLANLENSKVSLDKETIKNNYFNHLKQYFSAEESEGATILADIQEVQDHVIFENLFNKNKEIFSLEQQQLNEKYSSITEFNSRIFEKIEKTKKFTNLSEEEKFTYQRAIMKNFSQFNMQYKQYINLQKQLEQNNGNLLSKEELQAKHDEIVSQIKQLDISMQPNLPPESAMAILQEITRKLDIVQQTWNHLSVQQRQEFKNFYRSNMFCYEVNNNFLLNEIIKNTTSHKFILPILEEIGINNEKLKEGNFTITDQLLLSFIFPTYLYISNQQAVDFSNEDFRKQLVEAINICGRFFHPNEYKDFKLDLDLLASDQVFPSSVVYLSLKEKLLVYFNKDNKKVDFANDDFYKKIENHRLFTELLNIQKESFSKKSKILNQFPDSFMNDSMYLLYINGLIEEFLLLDEQKLDLLSKYRDEYECILFKKLIDEKLIQEFLSLDVDKLKLLLVDNNNLGIRLHYLSDKLIKQFLALDKDRLQILLKASDIFFSFSFQNLNKNIKLNNNGVDFSGQFLTLDKEKLEILLKCSKLPLVIKALDSSNSLNDFFNLDNQKLDIISKFNDLEQMIYFLNRSKLTSQFFALTNEQLQNLHNNIDNWNGDNISEYIIKNQANFNEQGGDTSKFKEATQNDALKLDITDKNNKNSLAASDIPNANLTLSNIKDCNSRHHE